MTGAGVKPSSVEYLSFLHQMKADCDYSLPREKYCTRQAHSILILITTSLSTRHCMQLPVNCPDVLFLINSSLR